jgi:hypothetical protein
MFRAPVAVWIALLGNLTDRRKYLDDFTGLHMCITWGGVAFDCLIVQFVTADRFGEQRFIAVVLCGARILRKRAEFFDSILEKAWQMNKTLDKWTDESLT